MSNLMRLSKEWHLSTALYDAIEEANVRQVASLLLEKHANPNVIIPDYGITPFHLAVGHENERFSREITKLLLKNGGDPNAVGIDGITPLHVAVAWNRSVIVRLLLSYGADPWILDDLEKNSFHYAYEEQAWDALKTLEIFRRTQNMDFNVNEKKTYSIQLNKVIIHTNDVQAEYKPHYNGSCCNTSKSTQTIGTQTPFLVSKIQQSSHDSHDFSYDITKDLQESDDNFTVDDSFEWCEGAQDLMISEDCKRKIVLHRSRSKVYEYCPDKRPVFESSPDKRAATEEAVDETDGDSKPKFFDGPNCHQRDHDTQSSASKEEDSLNTVEENVRKKSVDVEVQTVACVEDGCNNLVEMRKLASPDCFLFSEESLLSEDQSDCASTKEKPVFYQIETLKLIDDSASVSSLSTDNVTSRKKDCESATSTPQRKSRKGDKAVVKVSRDDLKGVSWSRCLRNCTCIPKRINESDSFTAYQTDAKGKSELVSGVDTLPEETAVGKSEAEKYDSESSGIDVVEGSDDLSNYVNPNISIELKYTDEEDGIEFIEAKLPLSASSKPNTKKNESPKRSSSEGAVEESEPSDPGAYDTDYIRKELKKVGFFPGPMVGTPTKRLYLKKLRRIRKTVASPVAHFIKPSFSSELEQVLENDSWLETLSKWSKLETDMRDNFSDCSRSSSWRNGTAKTSFTYLLLDPRISDNLPARYEQMELIDVWRTFIKAIFYIGKGTRARPYEHLHEAFLVWGETKASKKRRCSLKVKHILDIWNDGMGTVCVQAFHNLIPAEAFTREAAMIDAIGLPRLKNEKCGMYYGVAASWNSKLKKRLGAFLLYRALRIFVAQNEVQLKPTDVK